MSDNSRLLLASDYLVSLDIPDASTLRLTFIRKFGAPLHGGDPISHGGVLFAAAAAAVIEGVSHAKNSIARVRASPGLEGNSRLMLAKWYIRGGEFVDYVIISVL